MIQYPCPYCGKSLSIPDQYAGKAGKCNHCGHAITVPIAVATPETGPPAERESVTPPQPLSVRERLHETVSYVCPGCYEEIVLSEKLSGKRHVCVLCGRSSTVPGTGKSNPKAAKRGCLIVLGIFVCLAVLGSLLPEQPKPVKKQAIIKQPIKIDKSEQLPLENMGKYGAANYDGKQLKLDSFKCFYTTFSHNNIMSTNFPVGQKDYISIDIADNFFNIDEMTIYPNHWNNNNIDKNIIFVSFTINETETRNLYNGKDDGKTDCKGTIEYDGSNFSGHLSGFVYNDQIDKKPAPYSIEFKIPFNKSQLPSMKEAASPMPDDDSPDRFQVGKIYRVPGCFSLCPFVTPPSGYELQSIALIKKMPENTEFTVLEVVYKSKNNPWYFVSIDNETGWVNSTGIRFQKVVEVR